MSIINEHAHWFGPSQGLLGIITLPPVGVSLRSPGVALTNPGMLHRVGGARLNVRLARRLAARGFPSIRFDLSGLGDSAPRHDPRPYLESMAADVSQALDDLTTHTGIARFALVGHCSGAAVSYTAALSDARVAALIQIEGFAYPTPLYQAYRWRRILLNRRNWVALLKGSKDLRPIARRGVDAILRRSYGPPLQSSPEQSLEDARRNIRNLVDLRPPQAAMLAGLAQLVSRRVRMLNIFAGGDHHYYSYRGQFADAFPGLDFGDLLEVEHVPMANHYFSALPHQAWLDDRIAVTIERTAADLVADVGGPETTPGPGTPDWSSRSRPSTPPAGAHRRAS